MQLQGVFYCNFGRPLQCSCIALLIASMLQWKKIQGKFKREKGAINFGWLGRLSFQNLWRRERYELAAWDLLADLSELLRQGGGVCQPARNPGGHFFSATSPIFVTNATNRICLICWIKWISNWCWIQNIKHPKNWETALWGKERLYWKKGFIERKASLKKKLKKKIEKKDGKNEKNEKNRSWKLQKKSIPAFQVSCYEKLRRLLQQKN